MTQTLERPHLKDVLAAVDQIIEAVGEELIGSMTFSSNSVIAIQPSHLDQGESIAAALGLTSFVDHTALVPAVTDWSGTWPCADGPCEVYVRGTRLLGTTAR